MAKEKNKSIGIKIILKAEVEGEYKIFSYSAC